jgi:hypothetical protein
VLRLAKAASEEVHPSTITQRCGMQSIEGLGPGTPLEIQGFGVLEPGSTRSTRPILIRLQTPTAMITATGTMRPFWRTFELKSETWQWEQTGNICIEYRQGRRPSGIAVTEVGDWVHELKRDGETLVYLMFPIERLKELARKAYAQGRHREGGGDDGRFCVILIPLSEILR